MRNIAPIPCAGIRARENGSTILASAADRRTIAALYWCMELKRKRNTVFLRIVVLAGNSVEAVSA
jgi:hypothetical protein